MEFLKELLSEFLGLDELATSVSDNRAVIDALAGVAGVEIITLFEPGDIDVFAKDQKITDRFDALGAYYRNGMLALWAEVRDDSLPEDGQSRIEFRINKPLPFEFGGVGSKLAGHAAVWNGVATKVGTMKYDPAAGRFYVMVEGAPVSFRSGIGRSDDWPFSFHYGLNIHALVMVP